MDIWSWIEANYPVVVSSAGVLTVLGMGYVGRRFSQRKKRLAELAEQICDPGTASLRSGFPGKENPEWIAHGQMKRRRMCYFTQPIWGKDYVCGFGVELPEQPDKSSEARLKEMIKAAFKPSGMAFYESGRWGGSTTQPYKYGLLMQVISSEDEAHSAPSVQRCFEKLFELLDQKPLFIKNVPPAVHTPLPYNFDRRILWIAALVGILLYYLTGQ
jgi:hypothetical protein